MCEFMNIVFTDLGGTSRTVQVPCRASIPVVRDLVWETFHLEWPPHLIYGGSSVAAIPHSRFSDGMEITFIAQPVPSRDDAILFEVCELWLNGHTQWEDHLLGKKHRRNVRRSR